MDNLKIKINNDEWFFKSKLVRKLKSLKKYLDYFFLTS